MGVKTRMERMLAVDVGPHGFQSNTPRIALPGVILISLCVLLVVVSIVCFVLHAFWEVSRQDETYEDYFLITAIIAICLGAILGILGAVWCLFIHKRRRQDIEAYQAKKFAKSTENLNRSQSTATTIQNQPSVQYHADTEEVNSVFDRQSHAGPPTQDLSFGPNPYYHGYAYGPPRQDLSFGPNPHYQRGGYPSSRYGQPETPDYRPVVMGADPPLPRVASRPPETSTGKINRVVSEGVQDLKDFVRKSKNGSPQNEPFYRRLPPPNKTDFHDDEDDEHGRFDYSHEPPFANQPSLKPPELEAPKTDHSRPQLGTYKYEGGRPQHTTASPPPLNDSGSSEESDIEIIFKDGQWYKYKRGRPVGVYVEKPSPRKSANYKYVHGKPVKTDGSGAMIAGHPSLR